MRVLLASLVAFAVTLPALAEDQQPAIKMIKMIEQDQFCRSASGDEIKARVPVRAPAGKYFSIEEVHITTEPGSRSFTDKAEPGGCRMQNPIWETVRIQAKNGSIMPVSVLRGFDVYGHADCGSGELTAAQHIAKGDRIVVMCTLVVDHVYDMPLAQ